MPLNLRSNHALGRHALVKALVMTSGLHILRRDQMASQYGAVAPIRAAREWC